MKRENKTLKVAIAIVISVIILISIFLVAYLKTDILKNNKQLFLKYLSQIYSERKGTSNEELSAYIEKRIKAPYKNEGGLEVNITADKGENKYANLNNCNFRFYGQVDTPNNKAEQNISINYSDSAKFPFTYKQIGEKIGVKIDAIGNKSIIIKDSKKAIKDMTSSTVIEDTLENEEEQIENNNDNKVDTDKLTKEEKIKLIKSFAIKMVKGIDNEKVSKVQEDLVGYKFELTEEELKNLLDNILEEVKNENQDNKKITRKLQDIKEEIDENFETKNKNEKISLTVYKNAGKLSKIKLDKKDLMTEIIKNPNNEGKQYAIKLTSKNESDYLKNIELKATFKGLSGLENVYENIDVILKFKDKEYTYKINNIVKFVDSVNIEEFTKENSVNLKEYKLENVMKFMASVTKRIQITNKKLMAEIGVGPNDNPLKYFIPSFEDESVEELEEEKLEEEKILELNTKYENYQGGNIKGVTVKGLLKTMIEKNNDEENKYKIEEINFKGEEKEASEENLNAIIEEMNNNKDKEYKVEFEKEETGAIYRVIINEK